MAKYTLNGKNYANVFNGTNASANPLNLPYHNFPGTVNDVVSHKFSTDSLIHPLDTPYKYMLRGEVADMASNRYAKFDDFEWIANNPEQLLNAPAETTHISGILIGGGGGGGASGGGNNPNIGSDTAGAGGGGGGSGAQVFFHKLEYKTTIRIIIGNGGSGGQCEYRTVGDPGGDGEQTNLKYAGGNDIYHANGGGRGNGGANGNANSNGVAGGNGGAKGNADGTPTYTPNVEVTKNDGVAGSAGNTWDGAEAKGGAGGQISGYTNIVRGNGGQGGTANGKGDGAGANDGHGGAGGKGFARIYYLMEYKTV